jgi:thymidylate synthase ThyX
MTESNDLPLKWADRAQYHAEESHDWDEKVGVPPKATLIWMTPDPLGALASFNQMYEGNVIRSMNDVDDDMRRKALSDVLATHLQAPLENIKVQFLLEGGDRAFQQQLTRQRTAVYAIESLRFAVKGDLAQCTTLPPHLYGTEGSSDPDLSVDFCLEDIVKSWEYTHRKPKDQQRALWDYSIDIIDKVYHHLVDAGMPAEEARGLLPLATAGPIQFTTDMRNLIAHSGNRLCTQAQFHWRSFFVQMVDQPLTTRRRLGRVRQLPTVRCSSRSATSLAAAPSRLASTVPARSVTG